MIAYERIAQLAAETAFTPDQVLAIGYWLAFFEGVFAVGASILVFKGVGRLLNYISVHCRK